MGRISFAVDNVNRKFWLTFYDKRSKKPLAKVTVTDEAAGENMVYRWFNGGRRQVLVEIAAQLPEGDATVADAEAVAVGGVPGFYSESARTLLLVDGETKLLIRYWNGGREEIMEYAETLVEANR